MTRLRTLGLLALSCPLAATGCGAGSSGSTGPDGSSASTGASGAAAGASAGSSAGTAAPIPGGVEVGGISYRFDLPASPRFEIARTEVDDLGIVTRIWQHALAEGGPYCYVSASEQAGFDGSFPESTQALWRTAVRSVVHNDPIEPPPAGTRAALLQEGRAVATLDKDGSEVEVRLFQRAYLTPDGTLVKLLASAPEESLADCGPAAVVASLRTTGTPFTAGATST